MSTINLRIDSLDLEVVLFESPHMRKVVAAWMAAASPPIPAVKDIKESLRNYILRNFNRDHWIAAIKYVREWAVDNNVEELKGLANAKNFVTDIFPGIGKAGY